MRGATGCCCESRIRVWISIHAPHARSDGCSGHPHHTLQSISIHAPHARSDLICRMCWTSSTYFNPRSSCEERLSSPFTKPKIVAFQSTLLMRGATRGFCISVQGRSNFNPRSSCEERPDGYAISRTDDGISIHAPHARSDVQEQLINCYFRIFQSTLLMRGATAVQTSWTSHDLNFNPRSSCEERHEQ